MRAVQRVRAAAMGNVPRARVVCNSARYGAVPGKMVSTSRHAVPDPFAADILLTGHLIGGRLAKAANANLFLEAAA